MKKVARCILIEMLYNTTNNYYHCVHLIGTHDIQNISVTSPHPGEVRVTGELIDGSTATGALIIIYSLTNDSDVHYEIITAGPGKTINVSVVGLNGGEYGVSTFALENGGLPFTRVAALPKTVQVTGSEQKGLCAFVPNINQAHTCKTLGIVTKPKSIASTHAQMLPRNIIHARAINFVLATTHSA